MRKKIIILFLMSFLMFLISCEKHLPKPPVEVSMIVEYERVYEIITPEAENVYCLIYNENGGLALVKMKKVEDNKYIYDFNNWPEKHKLISNKGRFPYIITIVDFKVITEKLMGVGRKIWVNKVLLTRIKMGELDGYPSEYAEFWIDENNIVHNDP